MEKYYEVVKEFLDADNNVEDFIVLNNDDYKSYDDAFNFAESIQLNKDDGHCNIAIWEHIDDSIDVTDSWVVKTI